MGTLLNLEPALKLGDELGGHIVTGHVDGVGEVVGVCPRAIRCASALPTPKELAPYLAPKGSITVDGVSLTVNDVADQADGTCHFALNIIPHTAEVTTLGELAAGRQGEPGNRRSGALSPADAKPSRLTLSRLPG